MTISLACLVLFAHTAMILDSSPKDARQPPVSVSERKLAPVVLELPAKDPQPKPVTVAEVMKGLGLDETKMSHGDEPPGKLRELRWSRTKLPGTETEVDIEIAIVYTLDVFSIERKWDINAVRAARVTKVTIKPPGGLD